MPLFAKGDDEHALGLDFLRLQQFNFGDFFEFWL